MERSRFDALARAVATPQTRRGIVGGITALIAGLASHRLANAACPPEQVSAPGNRCVCRTTGRPPIGGTCPCPSGQTRCDGVCRTTASYLADDANCGGCDQPCTNGTTCEDGGCVEPCRELQSLCSDISQCCAGPNVICGPLGYVNPACCKELGSSCTTGGECCGFAAAGGGSRQFISCASGVCGGVGGNCNGVDGHCASGVCCGYPEINIFGGICCDVGETCSEPGANGVCQPAK